MSAYGNMNKAFPGLIADNNDIKRNESRACQESNGIGFGTTVWGYLGSPNRAYSYYLDTAKIVWDADFVTSNSITVTVNGVTTTPVIFTTDHDTTIGLVRDTVAGLTGVDAALDSTDVNNRTLYVRTIGKTNTTSVSVILGASQAGDVITYQSDQVFLGVAQHIQKNTETLNDSKYYQYESVSILETGYIWALIAGTVLSEDTAYIINSGVNAGKFSATAGLAVNTIFRSNNYTNPTSADALAVIKVNGTIKPNTEITWM